jgi:PhnB protein
MAFSHAGKTILNLGPAEPAPSEVEGTNALIVQDSLDSQDSAEYVSSSPDARSEAQGVIAMSSPRVPIPCAIAPWLTVRNGEQALRFYQQAFGAKVVYRLEDPDAGVVARLSVEGAEFWLSDGQLDGSRRESLGGGSVRMILTVGDPDTVFAQALAAGASEVFPVGEEHGWRLGRLVDPFGLHWEIGHPLAA